ncbi:MAG: D-alanine--D-alanine ligase family protein [Moorellaceae bacterium]
MLHILFLFNAVPARAREGIYSDCLTWDTVRQIYQALAAGGNKIYPLNLRRPSQLEQALLRLPKLHLAFVLAEGFLDEPHTLYDGSGAAAVRKLLNYYDVPASHSPVETMEICRNKSLTYRVLQKYGFPVPRHRLVDPGKGDSDTQLARAVAALGFPLFVKPNGGGNSIGIDADSLVGNYEQLQRKVEALTQNLGPLPILVEEYLSGQELTIGVLGQSPSYVLPPLVFTGRKIRTMTIKREENEAVSLTAADERYIYLGRLAAQVFSRLGARDALRLDLRADSQGRFYVIDVNGTPSLNPTSSLTAMALSLGLTYTQLINFVLYQSLLNYGFLPGNRLQDLVAPVVEALRPYSWEKDLWPS